ncbi:MAG: UDP-N-acetylmuramoyl-tripeptide--D-alanyl-D-alanine ligase [Actinobacteria bacterium]|nr:UDP-N-acetylmuramoyl-tripeptide--D-alanyl-D-alanine ligase [Actinomycetota bacterium]
MLGADVEVTHVVTDSRRAASGALFFALPGEHTDGSRYVQDAFASGAAAVVVPDGVPAAGPALRVGSPGEALVRLAADERATRIRDVPVIGVTGANGKTSTKDLAAAVLGARFRTHASPASFNNEIGLPLTLLTAPEGVELIVAEMGARRIGDVRLLCEVARPDVVVVTNVGVAHMEIFGSWEAIVEAAAEPVEALGPNGVAILNADDPVADGLAVRTGARVVTFGQAVRADVRGEAVELGADGRCRFALASGDAREPVELAVPGEHMVPNALAAAACGLVMGLTAAECATGLKGARISHWRMETFSSPDGIRVVNDAYNANPESMAAALKAARWMARDSRLIAVLGVMAELGAISDEEHERIGELVARIGVGRLVTVGAGARRIALAGIREGVEPENVASYDDPEEALDDVRAHARPGDVLLFKGSRVAGLERLAEALR